MSTAVLGGGAFGTALAIALAGTGPVTLWARNPAPLLQTRQSPHLPDITLPVSVTVTADLEGALQAGAILFAVPTQQLSTLLERIPRALAGKAMVACCKGIDLQTLQGPAALLARRWPGATAAILTGPSFAADIARGLPTALTLACADTARGKTLQAQLSTPTLRLYRSTDVTGAELGGALKNVVAIACGVTIGAGLGDSARAAVMTRGFAEMTRFATARGARAETLAGLSGFGDLVLTCTSEQSRNYRFGLALGRGTTFDTTSTVEGAATARALHRITQDSGPELPIASAVAALVDGRRQVGDVVADLLTRPLKPE